MSGKPQPDDRCRYVSADGRRCAMLRSKGHPSLCPQHRRQQLAAQADAAAVATELLGAIENFQTASAVNHALGRLLVLAFASCCSAASPGWSMKPSAPRDTTPGTTPSAAL